MDKDLSQDLEARATSLLQELGKKYPKLAPSDEEKKEIINAVCGAFFRYLDEASLKRNPESYLKVLVKSYSIMAYVKRRKENNVK